MSRATGRVIGMGLGLIFLAILPSQMSNAGQPSPLLQQETLTLTDAHGWTPQATLDTTQVEAPEADTYPIDEAQAKAFGDSLGPGWQPFDGDIYDAEEQPHEGCYVNVGITTVAACADGYTSLS